MNNKMEQYNIILQGFAFKQILREMMSREKINNLQKWYFA